MGKGVPQPWGKVREEKKTGCASQETGVHIYVIYEKTLRSTYVDDVSTQNRIKGLIRTYEITWRSTYEAIEYMCQ